jgi:hypothetical protein
MASGFQQPPVKSNATGMALGISGLVIGILALLFSFIPCLGALAFWPGVVAVVLSALSVVTSVRAKGLAIAALVVSISSTGVAYWQWTRVKDVGEDLKGRLDSAASNISNMKPKD